MESYLVNVTQDKTYCRTVVYAAIGLQRFCTLGNDAVTLCVT